MQQGVVRILASFFGLAVWLAWTGSTETLDCVGAARYSFQIQSQRHDAFSWLDVHRHGGPRPLLPPRDLADDDDQTPADGGALDVVAEGNDPIQFSSAGFARKAHRAERIQLRLSQSRDLLSPRPPPSL